MRRNFSIFALYSLKFTCCLLFVVKSLDTHSKIARYLLQKLLIAKTLSLLVVKVTHCKKSLAARCKFCSLLATEVTHCQICITRHLSCTKPGN